MDLVRGADDGNQQQYHRSLDAAEDCVTATIGESDCVVTAPYFGYKSVAFGCLN